MKLSAGPALDVAASSSERQAAASVRSLRILLLLCALLPLGLFATFAAYRYNKMHQEAGVRLDRVLRIAHEHALKVLEINATMLAHVVDLADEAPDTPERRQQLQLQLHALAEGKPQIQSIRVLDASGRPIASSLAAPPNDLQFADRDYFRWHRAGSLPEGLFFSEMLLGRATGTYFFDVSRARRNASGEFIGLVNVSLRPEYFSRFYADLSANEPGLAITLFRRDGTVYARWPQLAGAAPTARMAASSAVLQRVLAGETAGLVRGVSSLDRSPRVIQFQQVGAYPVYLGTGMELSAVRRAWLREMGLLAGFAAVPVLGVLIAGLAAMKRARQAEEAARRLREESQARVQIEEALRQAQKMEAVGRLTGGVAHDFNNALMVISANLHMLKLTQPGLGTRQTDAIGRAVDSATKLTRQLLAFSRRQALLPQVLQLQERLPQLKDLVAPVLGRQVELEIAVAPGAAPVKVDLAELELALLNLAVNAKDAMPDGGSFRIEARNGFAPDVLAGPAVIVSATDTGSGIPPEVLARVFEPFFTTKPVGEGTGLGLSQVYGFCQRSGGLARIRSQPGAGTTVEMVLPAIDGPVDADRHDEDGALAPLDLRVLLVEDNADVSAAILPVLEAFGCKVTHFALAAPAIQWLDRHAGEIDAILTDVVMPGELDGVALARHVREAHPQLRLVVMTGYAAQLEEITRQGFTVLAKPWTAANLARALRSL